MNTEYFMSEALREASIALERGDWPIGCVIELDGNIVARSCNGVYSMQNKMAHAEMLALQQIGDYSSKRKSEATLYTTYEPCPMCFGAIVLNRIGKVVAGIDLDKSGAMFFRENLPLLFKQEKFHVDFTRGVMAEECHALFIQGEPTKKLIRDGIIRERK